LTELAEDRTQALAATRITTEERLYEVAGGYVPKASVVVHAELAEDTAGAIARAATRLDVDVIAIGTHGRTGMSHVLMGSVAEAVVRNATVPVLVVGPKVKVVPPA
jgi:nucleotide-binding universal stress UspA family protein